ncbi:MAG: SIS domain-containing protein [Sphaerochaetaceae bacterium]|nr:SIS domain-containing protein [Sphaerochaetaceae bacterium]
MEYKLIQELITRIPELEQCELSIVQAFEILKATYRNTGKVLCCGNGGSAADCEHIVGELMKGFLLPREVITQSFPDRKLQNGLPAISLVSHSALISAIANDIGADMVYAQQVIGYGNEKDCMIGITTSGNSTNIINAMKIAKERKLNTIGMTGKHGGLLKNICDCCICVPSTETFRIQEYHLPIYHTLCAMVEAYFFM